jgi:hypothetical protein
VSVLINGVATELPPDPRVSLLDFFRERLALTGTKKGCNQGGCGACTVLADGVRILSCLALAAQYDGRRITKVVERAENGRVGEGEFPWHVRIVAVQATRAGNAARSPLARSPSACSRPRAGSAGCR